MLDKNGKRAVIISNIRSNSIEQAIFILKSNDAEPIKDVGSGIVAEAQEIINNYIKKVERALPCRAKHKNRRKISVIAVTAVMIAIVGGLALLKLNMS